MGILGEEGGTVDTGVIEGVPVEGSRADGVDRCHEGGPHK